MTRLTAAERETVILMNDEDDFADIFTHQRKIITKLRKNPSAVLIEEGMVYGTQPYARFRIPAELCTFRSGKRKLSDEQRAEMTARFRRGLND